MDKVVILNFTLNGTTVSSQDGVYCAGETSNTLASGVTAEGNVFTFADPFKEVYIQPSKAVNATIGVAASADNGLLVGTTGIKLSVSGKKLSFYASEETTVTVLAVLS